MPDFIAFVNRLKTFPQRRVAMRLCQNLSNKKTARTNWQFLKKLAKQCHIIPRPILYF